MYANISPPTAKTTSTMGLSVVTEISVGLTIAVVDRGVKGVLEIHHYRYYD